MFKVARARNVCTKKYTTCNQTQENLLLYYIFKSSVENVLVFAEYLEKFEFSLK